MKLSFIKISILLLVLSFQVKLYSQVEKSGKLIIEITNIRNEKGDVKLSLFDKAEPYPGEDALAVARIITKIDGTTASAVFEEVPFGEYAVAVLHDENSNFIMDTSWIGFPKEGMGASNDARAKMGPPKFEDAKFSFNKPELRLKIKMVYL